MKIHFMKNPFESLAEKYTFTLDGSMWDRHIDDEQLNHLSKKIQDELKKIFASIKFNDNMITCFNFDSVEDEAYYIVWSIDRELEIEI